MACSVWLALLGVLGRYERCAGDDQAKREETGRRFRVGRSRRVRRRRCPRRSPLVEDRASPRRPPPLPLPLPLAHRRQEKARRNNLAAGDHAIGPRPHGAMRSNRLQRGWPHCGRQHSRARALTRNLEGEASIYSRLVTARDDGRARTASKHGRPQSQEQAGASQPAGRVLLVVLSRRLRGAGVASRNCCKWPGPSRSRRRFPQVLTRR